MLSRIATLALLGAALLAGAHAKPASQPPKGALVVRQQGTKTGEYVTIQAAVDALNTTALNGSEQTIFVHAGTYNEQVYIVYPEPLTIIGETRNSKSYKENQVTLTYSLSKNEAGHNDESGTLRLHKSDVSIYNLNIANTYGHPVSQSQALALSAYGGRLGFYGCSFSGYQDTIFTTNGTQYFGRCAVTGATDYIFGETGASYFKDSDIMSIDPGYITAGRPKAPYDKGIYVFESCTIKAGKAATSSLAGQVYLGRPWGDYARSIFLKSHLTEIINPAGWSTWSTATPNVAHVTYAEFNNHGVGADTSLRANFSTVLNKQQAKAYGVAQVLGSDWKSWVDGDYY